MSYSVRDINIAAYTISGIKLTRLKISNSRKACSSFSLPPINFTLTDQRLNLALWGERSVTIHLGCGRHYVYLLHIVSKLVRKNTVCHFLLYITCVSCGFYGHEARSDLCETTFTEFHFLPK